MTRRDNIETFSNSQQLAKWSAEILKGAKIDGITDWTMLEYWFQVELWRAVKLGTAGEWKSMGGFEHPYYTHFKKGNAKINWKWIDLAFAEPNLEQPRRIVWLELKDLGRPGIRLIPNSQGVGRDLAALVGLDIEETLKGWGNPTDYIKDNNTKIELPKLANGIRSSKPKHYIGQIVIMPKNKLVSNKEDEIMMHWEKSFKNNTKNNIKIQEMNIKDKIARSDTDQFAVFALFLEHESVAK